MGCEPRGWRVSFKIGVKREATLGRKFLFIDTTRLSTLQPPTTEAKRRRRLECFGFSSVSLRDIGVAPRISFLCRYYSHYILLLFHPPLFG